MTSHRLYDEIADLWPLVAGGAYYAAEAQRVLPVLRRELRLNRKAPGNGPAAAAKRPTLMELGVGGGHVIAQLAPTFDCVGVDLSPRMLEHSARLNPSVEHVAGDMRTVRLGRTFDAVLLHDSVHYMLGEPDLLAAFETAAIHLRPGGVVLALPGYVRETFRVNDTSYGFSTPSDGAGAARVASGDNSGGELTHMAYTVDPDPSDTTYTLVMLMFVRGEGKLRVEEDRHTLGLFPRATWVRVMERAGFGAKPSRLRTRAGRPVVSQDVSFVGIRR